MHFGKCITVTSRLVQTDEVAVYLIQETEWCKTKHEKSYHLYKYQVFKVIILYICLSTFVAELITLCGKHTPTKVLGSQQWVDTSSPSTC